MSVKPRVAIACQGGGSHAAFAAGVLSRLFSTDFRHRFDPVALSGTSGGAVCAALAWAGLVSGGPDDVVRRLKGFWEDLEVRDLLDAAMNFWTVTLARLPVTQEISPYAYEPLAAPVLRSLLQRHLDLDALPAEAQRRSNPRLLIGATDILSGERTIFPGTEALTYDMLIASAAIPPLYRAVPIGDKLYWDGLFASNPPVRELTDPPNSPDEIWVIQINPQLRPAEPRSIRDINDRRNQLSGNLSLGQELYFIDKINQLLDSNEELVNKKKKKYQRIKIRAVELGIADLDYPSKLDRSSILIESLLKNGAELAERFFKPESEWPHKGAAPAGSVLYHA